MNINEFRKAREICLKDTKAKIRASVNEDVLISQAISCIDELDKIINQIVVRVREWYSWYNPEFSNKLTDNEKFIEIILKKDKKALLAEINAKESMGKDLEKQDVDAIMDVARSAKNLIDLRENQKKYLETIERKACPNLLDVLSVTLAAKIIRHGGSLRRIAMTPAPVIQIMGAEKALFKHMSRNAKSPKYGILFAHPLINNAIRKNKGKIARTIADKAAIAAKIDFFKGKYIGQELKKQIEKKAALLK